MTTANVHFLLVDDLEENLTALEALLRRQGLSILKARSGQEALELLLLHDVALALVDVQMPGMDGYELAELMRGTERTRRIPIIFVTAGTADRQRRFRGYEAGAVDFLNKPIEPDILRSKADVFFELYRQRQEVASQRDELQAAAERIQGLLEESRRQGQALQEADKRKDEFLAMLAHELRNPLAPIRNAVEILRQEDFDKEVFDETREIIARQVAHMARLIDDLLDVARIVRGKIELQKSTCDLAEIVRATSDDYRPTLEAVGLTLELELPQRTLLIEADSTRLSQIVGNLLHNAGKFTASGGRVTVAVSEVVPNCAEVRVRDTGIGFETHEFEQMFEPFRQIEQSLGRDKGGLGLGLALTKGLAALHGGTVSATSPGVGKGAEFVIRLPLPELRKVRHSPGDIRQVRASKDALRVLIVEDNVDAARMLQLLLSAARHEVKVATTGEQALSAADDFAPNVIISDLGLPGGINGYELSRLIRKNPLHAHTYLIALSGYGQENDRVRTAEAGFDLHLVKPIDFAQLQIALSNVRSQP